MQAKTKIIIVIFIIIGMAAYGWWSNNSRTVFAHLETTLAAELSQALGSQANIGQLHMVGLTAAAVDNAVLFDKQGRELAAIKRVVVDYNLLSLVRGQAAITALRQITLHQPVVMLVEEEDSSWNAEFLTQQEKSDDSKLSAKVIIEQGVVNVNARQGQWKIANIDGQLVVRDSQEFDIRLTADHNDAGLKVTGAFNSAYNKLALTVKAEKLNPAAYQALLPESSGVTFTSGLLREIDATITRSAAGTEYAGEASFDHIAAQTAGINIEQATGRVSFTNKYVYILGANALAAGQPVSVRGKIGIAGEQPVLDINVASPGFDPAALGKDLPVAGHIAFDASVTGVPDGLIVTAGITAQHMKVMDYVFQDTKANVTWAGDVIAVGEFVSKVAGGQVRGQGMLNMASQHYQVQLAADNIDAAGVSGLPITVSGKGDLYAEAAGQGSDWKKLHGSMTLSLASGQLEGIAYTKMTGLVEHDGVSTIIKHYDMLLPSGLVMAEGTVRDNILNIKVDGQGVELADMPLIKLGNVKLAGRVGFQGGLTGSIDKPELSLSVNAAGLVVNQQLLGQAAGKLTASPDAITFEQIELSDGTASHRLTGKVLLTGAQPELNLRLATRSARAETFARMIVPEFTLTGNIEQEILLQGPIDNITARGRVRLTEGSFDGYLITKAVGSYHRKNGVITVDQLAIEALNSRITLAGTMTDEDKLDFAVTARHIDMARLKIEYPYPVAGLLDVTGRITGSVSSPEVSGLLTTDTVMLNGQQLNNVHADLSYHGRQANIRELRFAQGKGSYVFNGAVDFATRGVDGLLRAEGGELAGILAIANLPDRGVRGQLSGEIVLSGSIGNPNMMLRGAIADGKIKNYVFDSVDIDAELKNKVITVNKLMARQGQNGVLAAKGQADLNGAIDLEVGGRSIDIGIVPALFDTTVETTGQFSFTAQASGATADPDIAVSLEVENGSVASGEFDHLYGLLLYSKGSIHVNQLYVERGPYKASAYGIIPLKALNAEGRSKADLADTMNLKLQLDNADLRILPALTNEVAWATGPTTGQIDIGGTLAEPTLDGHLTVANGTVKLKELTDPIQKVGIDIRFKGDKININAFDGEMGGGRYSLNGSVRLNGLALDDYNIRLSLNSLGLKHKYFTGPIEGAMTVTSKNGRPHIAGSLLVENATINIPAVPDSEKTDINAGLDIELVVGKKVRLYNPYLYDFLAEGKVRFSGNLRRPDASGRIEARRGTVKYLTNRFTILSGSAEFTQFRSIEPVIKLQAETKFSGTRIGLNINGPATEMELKLTSEPAMSQQEIMSLLTLRGSYFSKNNSSGHDSEFGRDELISLLDAGLQMRFIAGLEGTLQDTLGVDEFRLVRTSVFNPRSKASRQSENQFQGYSIEIGKYLTDKLLINYTIGLDDHDNTVGFRYDLTKNIGIGGSLGGTTKSMLTVETRFVF